uniref:Uncharacterized protein n=1 Tax=Propithecus coquereli TaxID=379532 RepID=A0A2K6EF75_PROCO
MAAAALRNPAQFVGMEQRTKRHLLRRAFLKDCHRSGLRRQVRPPRILTPVRHVSQS